MGGGPCSIFPQRQAAELQGARAERLRCLARWIEQSFECEGMMVEMIADTDIPRAADAAFQHLLDTYASEANKTASVWTAFRQDDLAWRPHPRSGTVKEIMEHQLLSERRFFAEFLGSPEPAAAQVLPPAAGVEAYTARLLELAGGRLAWLASLGRNDWLDERYFFDVRRERIWIFWRRVLHTAHHRTQLTVYLRLLDRAVPPTYGPTADVTWTGADPTVTIAAAERTGANGGER